ncbi:MAG: flagellar basal body P-ring protein FlgI [Burkholderiales bacterium]
MKRALGAILVVILAAPAAAGAQELGVRVKELGRVDGVRENMISGYGIVTGLAGTGDSARSQATLQSVANALREFGLNVTPQQLSSRNVAAVLVTATLPPFARSGDRVDVITASMGDARSLTGGALLMTPLYGADRRIYALAQGAVSVGGYKFELNQNMVQKNHPTTGIVPEGAIVEADLNAQVLAADGTMKLVLFDPDYTTASRIAAAVSEKLAVPAAAIDAGRVQVSVPAADQARLVDFLARLESLTVQPDLRARVVINERTGTVVSGGGVRLSKVSVAHGDLKVNITTDFLVSQPNFAGFGGINVQSQNVRTAIVPQTRIEANESGMNSVTMPDGATVSDLVAALKQVRSTTRETIAILQSIKRAGALHAELVIQ